MMWSLVSALVVAAWPTHDARFELQVDGSLEVRDALTTQRLAVTALTREGWSCAPTLRAHTVVGPRVAFTRACELTERFTDVGVGLEHELVVSTRPPGRGALVVRLEVDAPWVGRERGGHRFGGPGTSGWLYGAAALVRPEGLVPLETRRVPTGLELVVPEAELDRPDAFPLLIDPLIGGLIVALDPDTSPAPSSGDERAPAVAFDAKGKQFLAVWADTRRSSNRFLAPEADLFAALIDPSTSARLDLMLKPDLGEQDRPAVAATDGGFYVAWEDGRAALRDVKVSFIALSPDAGALTATPVFSLPGWGPSLSAFDGREPLLAYVPRSSTPRVVRVVSLDGGQVVAFDAGFDLQLTGVARTSTDVAVGVSDAISKTALWFNTSLLSNSLGGDRIALVTDADTTYAVIRNTNAGAAGSTTAFSLGSGGGAVSTAVLMGHTNPAAAVLSQKAVVGSVTPSAIEVQQAGVASAPVTALLVAGADELALTGTDTDLVAAYTVGLRNGRDLQWSLVSTGGIGVSQQLAVTRAPLERSARVAFHQNRGIAVWLAGNSVRWRWLTLPANDGDVQFSPVFSLTARGVLGAVDVTVRADGSAVLVYSLQEVLTGPQLVVQPLPLDATSVGSSSGTQFALNDFVTALNVEAAGTSVYVVWKENLELKLLEFGVGNQGDTIGTLTVTGGFDFACSLASGQCLIVFENSTVRTVTLPGRVNGMLTGTGPVAAFVTADGPVAMVRRATAFEVVEVPSQLVIGRYNGEARAVALAGSPLVFAAMSAQSPPNTALGLVSEGALSVDLPGSWGADVALVSRTQGLAVFTRDDPAQLTTSVASRLFRIDAGTPDAGGTDAGLDAGSVDAGLDAGVADAGVSDAGPDPLTDGGTDGGFGSLVSSGCGCGALNGAEALAWVLLAWLVRRRR